MHFTECMKVVLESFISRGTYGLWVALVHPLATFVKENEWENITYFVYVSIDSIADGSERTQWCRPSSTLGAIADNPLPR